jgi:hypothetical protein
MNSNYRELHYFTWNDLTKQLISKACLYIPQNIASTKTLKANISNLQDSHMNIYWRTVLKGETRENQFHSLVSASASHAIRFIILLRIAYQYSSFLSRQQASQCLSSSIRNSSLIELCCFWRLQNVFEPHPKPPKQTWFYCRSGNICLKVRTECFYNSAHRITFVLLSFIPIISHIKSTLMILIGCINALAQVVLCHNSKQSGILWWTG